MSSKYCRMFRPDEGPQPETKSLEALGAAMATEETLTRARDDSRIPAGYTYLAHILAHDLTFDRTQGLPDGPMDLAQLRNARHPFIDLESIYGNRAAGPHHNLYQSDGVRLKLGAVKLAEGVRWDDLPREDDGLAIIGDEKKRREPDDSADAGGVLAIPQCCRRPPRSQQPRTTRHL